MITFCDPVEVVGLPALPWEYVVSSDGIRVCGGNGFSRQHFLTIQFGPHIKAVESLVRAMERELGERRHG